MANYNISRKEKPERHEQDTELRNAACFLLFVFFCVLIACLTSVFPNHRRNYKLCEKSARLRQEKEELVKRNENLKAEIIALQTDTFFIEAMARKKYNLVGIGELVIESENDTDED